MWDNSVVTNAGATLLAAWAGGGVLTITRASAGDQTAPVAQLVNLTALTHEVEDLGITESRVVDGGVRYRVQFEAAQTAYTAKQIGVWGKLGSGAETLIAVYQDGDGIDVPAASDIPDYLFAFFATIQMDNTGELQVTLDTTALVSQAEMAAAIQAGVNAILPVSVGNGGTGATDAAGARANLNIRAGRVTGVSLAAGAQDSAAVTFDTPMPSNQYVVTVTIYGSFSASVNVRYSTGGQTATGFTMRYTNTGSASQSGLIFDWIAVAI